jgi:hypothetical protein
MSENPIGQKYKDDETAKIIADLKAQLAEKDKLIERLEKLLKEQQGSNAYRP